MQAQSNYTSTKTVSPTQSLTAVKTLLRAGLGCITFMRDLLPQDNFTESHFTTSDDSMQAHSRRFSESQTSSKSVNGFKIMTISRGYTDEADKILNYLEYGIFDALQKQYLKSFTFAIYLDNKDPNNIVEAYTFNFNYYNLPGTNTIVPIMSLGDDLQRMSLHGTDPVVGAAERGGSPTLKDVKRSVKTLLKTLITCMTHMDALPKRRYAVFKVYYTDDTPTDYEPPHFKAGDYERDKWHFATHDMDEVPDTWSVGRLNAERHKVDIIVQSIAAFLPSSTEHEKMAFAGTVDLPRSGGIVVPNLTPAEELAQRASDIQKQYEDAQKRRVVWAAEDHWKMNDKEAKTLTTVPVQKPFGIKDDDGIIRPLGGGPPDTTRCGHDFRSPVDEEDTSRPNTPTPPNPPKGGQGAASVDSGSRTSSGSHVKSVTSVEMQSPENEKVEEQDLDAEGDDDIEDEEMLDLETQLVGTINPNFKMETQTSNTLEPIQSFDSPSKEAPAHTAGNANKKAHRRKSFRDEVECECGITEEDNCCACDRCGKWCHIWCMGYHSMQDPRLLEHIACFDCRLCADPSRDSIELKFDSTLIIKFRELASFRRAIKIVEKHSPLTSVEFAQAMGCENTQAHQLLEQLKTEGFISEETITTNENRSIQTRSKTNARGKGKFKQAKTRRGLQKQKFVFNRQSVRTQDYKDYFDPGSEFESQLLGIPQLRADFEAQKAATAVVPTPPVTPAPARAPFFPETQTTYSQSQTQDDVELSAAMLKRSAAQEDDQRGPRKRVKISIVNGVDLAE